MVMEVGKSIICCLEKWGRRWHNVALSLKAWESGGWSCKFWSESKCPKIRSLDVQGQEKMGFSAQAKRVNSPFSYIQAPEGLDDAHLHGWGRTIFFTQMLISSRYTLIDTPKSNVTPAIWASFSGVRLTHKTNHLAYVHTSFKLKMRLLYT